LKERNEKLREEVEDEMQQKKNMIDNYNILNNKVKGFIQILQRFWKENAG